METNHLPTHCDGCGNHCPIDNLHCGKGRKLLEKRLNQTASALQAKAAADGVRPAETDPQMQRMHMLHKLTGKKTRKPETAQALLSLLTEEEQSTLTALLDKLQAGLAARTDAPETHQKDKKKEHRQKHRDA